jgi:hypothetical protein
MFTGLLSTPGILLHLATETVRRQVLASNTQIGALFIEWSG